MTDDASNGGSANNGPGSTDPGSRSLDVFKGALNTLVDVLKTRPPGAYLAFIIIVVAIVVVLTVPNVGIGGLIAFLIFVLILVPVGLVVYGFRRDISKIATPVEAPVRRSSDVIELLTTDEVDLIVEMLTGAIREVVAGTGLPAELIRANIFLPQDGQLQIIPLLTVNMKHPSELDPPLTIPVGYGSTGRCYESGAPNIAVFRENWGRNVLSDADMRRLDPDLRWIVSIPVFIGGVGSQPTCVMNVDGLGREASEEELEPVARQLVYWAHFIGLVFKAAIQRSTM